MAALTVDFRKHSGPTPADDMAAQIITDFTLDFKQHGFCASPLFLQTLGPWFPNEMQNLLSYEKRTLDHWATGQLIFSLALVLKTSERSWCTHSSFSPRLVKLSQVFESPLLDSILKLPVYFAFNMLWYSTLQRATPFSNDPLWLTLLWRVLMIVFWTTAKSPLFPIIVVSKNKRYPEFILYGWSFI